MDIEEIIKGAKAHNYGKACYKCPYARYHNGCIEQLIEDMLAIIESIYKQNKKLNEKFFSCNQ